MPRAWKKTRRTFVSADTALTAGTEAVIATLPGISTPGADGTVDLDGTATFLGVAGTTTVTLRVRRASLTGTLVGEADAIPAAGAVLSRHLISTQDAPGDVASLTYVLTATAAGGNATCNNADLNAVY